VVAPRTPISSWAVATATTLAASFFSGAGEADQRFADNVGPDLVVERPGGPDAAVDQCEFVVVGGDIADRHPPQCLLLRTGADIDPDLMNLRNFLAVAFVHEVDRALARDALDWPCGGLNDDPAAGNHCAIMTADCVEVNEAVLVDVGDDQAEFVHMSGEHEHGIAAGIDGCRDGCRARRWRIRPPSV